MKKDSVALPKNDTNGSKPVQEDKPSDEQKPMGSEQEINKNKEIAKEGDDDNTNSVGIKK